jgi:ligand-binding sensor domain-containing protein
MLPMPQNTVAEDFVYFVSNEQAMKRILLTLLSVSFVFLSAHAQQWQDFTSQSRVKNMHIAGDIAYVATMGGMIRYDLATGQHQLFTKANSGLASDAVEVVKTEDLGTIWIGTYDAGITIYDGKTWTTYNTKNSPLPGNVILSLVIDSQNNKWIGTNKGLVKISDNGWTIYNSTTSPMADDDVWAMDIDNTGGLWIGCVTGSYLLKNDQWTDFSSQVPMYGVNGMACMPDGEVFNCGVGGVFVHKNDTWTDISEGGPAGLRNARKALRGPDGNIWVATDYDGLFKYDGVKWTGGIGSPEAQFGDNGTITLDPQGNLFAAGSKGISRYVSNSWEQIYQPVSSLRDNYVKSLASDMAGKIWAAHSGSVSVYDGFHWTYYTPENSLLPQGMIYKVRNDKPGSIWICTSGGLVHKEGENWKLFTKENAGFGTNEILDIAFDSKGIAWVSHDNGLSSYDGINWKHYGRPAQFSEYERGTVLITDKSNTVWMGSNLGKIAAWSGGEWQYFSEDNQTFPGGYVMDFSIDNAGKLWAATWGNNLCYFDGAKWEKLESASTLSATAVIAGKDGALWAASSYPATLTKYEDQTSTDVFNTDNSPISGRVVNALTQDEKGNIWIGTTYGVVMYSNSTTGIKDNKEKSMIGFEVYPNPCRNKTNVTLGDMEKPDQIETRVFDLTGKLLISQSHTVLSRARVLEIQTSTLAPGTYILELSQGSIAIKKKLVVIR